MIELKTEIFDLVKAIRKLPEGVVQFNSRLTETGWDFAYKLEAKI